jgi:transcription elongation factor Elf1
MVARQSSLQGRHSRDERMFCEFCGTEQLVEVWYDSFDNTWEWKCGHCPMSYSGDLP